MTAGRANRARVGDVVVEVRCQCAGAVLVKAGTHADYWTCEDCRRPGEQGRRWTITRDGLVRAPGHGNGAPLGAATTTTDLPIAATLPGSRYGPS